jgi:hypothetical protein
MPCWKLTRIRWIALLLLGLSGCADDNPAPRRKSAEQNNSQSERRMRLSDRPDEIELNKTGSRKLAISRFHDGDWVQLGVLEFDGSNRATLTYESSGPLADQLEQDWYAIDDKPELLWKKSVPQEVDGGTVFRTEGVMVRREDEAYIYAVFNTLERSYGYRVRLKRRQKGGSTT